MRLNSIHLCNFRQHADTRIDFDLGLTGIIGPNGAGKSTILEAIAWALYGMPAARGTRESIRFSRAGPRSSVKVSLEFELGGHRYRVERGLTSADVFLDGSSSPIANTLSGVTELLRRRIGMSREEFFNTYFTGQKELSVMAAMGPAERAQFLSRVLGYERLRSAQNIARDRRREIIAEIAGLRSGMPDPEDVSRMVQESEARLAAARTQLQEAERRRVIRETALAYIAPQWEQMQRERVRLQELLSELKLAESEAASLLRDRERLERELGELAVAREELEQLAERLMPLADIGEELQRLDSLYRDEGRRVTLLETMRALDDEIVRVAERKARVEEAPRQEEEVTESLEAARRTLERVEGELETGRTEWVRERQEAETKRQALRSQYSELKEQRERLVRAGEDGICPTCARPLGGHFRSVLDLLDSQLETVRVDGNYFKSRLDQLEEMPVALQEMTERRRAAAQEVANLERRLAKAQQSVQERLQLARELAAKEKRRVSLVADLAALPSGYDAVRHEELRREIERLTPLSARASRLSALIEREPQLAAEKARVDESHSALQARLADLQSRRDSVTFSEKDYARLRSEHESAQAESRAAELAMVAAQSDANNAHAQVEKAEEAKRNLSRLQERLAQLQSDKRLHDELDHAFTDIRTDLNQALRPEVSELASAFLAELTDSRYTELELDDQYNILIMEEGTPKPVISGGEEDIANLALRLAISQMIAERAGQPFSLLVLDEIFGSLDEARRQSVVELLRRLHDRFEQVIVITHIESVREGLDRVLTLRYDPESGASVMGAAEEEEDLIADAQAVGTKHDLESARAG